MLFFFFFFLICHCLCVFSFHFLCFSSLSPLFEPGPSPDVCRLALLLFKNILSSPLRASVR
uniref:Secreted protein n=1 Tax=Scleropages formosus TaxID=113540 RepID=A0A8C9VV98_SCLFO